MRGQSPLTAHLRPVYVRAMTMRLPDSRARVRQLALAGLAVLALGATSVACRVPREYQVSEVIGTSAGLRNPWEIAFLGDGTMFVTERAGDVGVRLTDGTFRRLGQQNRDVVASGEGGMMGLAIDPDFGTNRHIYTCYLTASDVRVVRWTVDQGLSALSGKQPLVTGIPRTSGRHSGCRLAFGPDGALWVTTGDAADCNNPQNPRSLAGKVLRVNRDGSTPPGNIGGNFLPQIYAYGFRNPQGISFRGDGAAFMTEHGPDRDDEITRLRPGGNGGWNPGCNYNEGVPMTNFGLGSNVMAPFWQSGGSTIAPSGSAIVTDADWGDRRGQLAVATLKGRHLRLFSITDGSADGGGPVLETGDRLRTAVEGPDGRLYLATDANPGRILAVQPVL